MSKIADYYSASSVLTLFSEELKEIIGTGTELNEKIIDLLANEYMEPMCYDICEDKKKFYIFKRDLEKAEEAIRNSDGVRGITSDDLASLFDKAGVDYILEESDEQ